MPPEEAFNPSLVRLALPPPVPRGRAAAAFNPSLVRLAQDSDTLHRGRSCPFNPSLVRLAPFSRMAETLSRRRFQSQLGSIGATAHSSSSRAQPHLSIPAWFDWRVVAAASTPDLAKLSIPAWFDWRCPASPDVAAGPVLSIPAWFDWRAPPASPTAKGAKLSIPAWFDWRHHIYSLWAQRLHAFNPSLVRLAPPSSRHRPGLPARFQSQLGSIGARRELLEDLLSDLLSIPAWFDWRAALAWRSSRSAPLSIPAWFDWRPIPQCRCIVHEGPFNPSLVRLAPSQKGHFAKPSPPFNPSLVRLARGGNIGCRGRMPPFNPSLVRLAPAAPHAGGDRAPRFQSQLGSIGARHHRWASLRAACFNPSLVRLAPVTDTRQMMER